jgi:hypothetical protein
MKVKHSIFFLLLIGACSNPQENQNELEVSTLIEKEELVIPEEVTKLFLKILGNQEGLFRGYEFGDDLRKIQESEVLEQFEDVKTHIGYSFDSANLETVDILYFRNSEDRLKAINIDIYLNSEESSEQMLQVFTNYLNTKYGKSTVNDSYITWESDEVSVKIKMVKTKLDTGLQIILEP